MWLILSYATLAIDKNAQKASHIFLVEKRESDPQGQLIACDLVLSTFLYSGIHGNKNSLYQL